MPEEQQPERLDHLVLAAPAKPVGRMTDGEIEAWTRTIAAKLAEFDRKAAARSDD
jgi:hypothetical protein